MSGAPLTPQQFVAKWRGAQQSKRAGPACMTAAHN